MNFALKSIVKRTSPQLRRHLSPLGWQPELPLSAPLSARRAVLRGFKPASYALYDFAHNDSKDYLPDTVFYASARLNGAAALEMLQDKLRFFEELGGELPIPPVWVQVVGGRLQPVAQPEGSASISSPEALLEYLRAHGEVIFKPRQGQKGRGVFALGLAETPAQLVWDGERLPSAELARALSGLDGYLVTEKVVHAPYADVFPHTVNSARVVVVQDQARGLDPFVPAAVQRFGAASTGVTDNAARGGVYARIDLKTGVLSAAVRPTTSFGEPNGWFSHHPEAGAYSRGTGAALGGGAVGAARGHSSVSGV